MLALYEIIIMALALSMDSFAVSLTSGAGMPRFTVGRVLKMAIVFALFQGAMPVIGYFLGETFRTIIADYDHWIAFIVLVVLGGKMLYESLHKGKEEKVEADPSRWRRTIALAIATSIDALAVGISFSFLQVDIILAVSIIALVTMLVSIGGLCIGRFVGARFSRYAETGGGVILLLLGVKILLQHLVTGC